jgi:enolase
MLAHARARGLPLWRAVRRAGPGDQPGPLPPVPMVNIISGGAHAGRLLDIQDVLVVPVGAAKPNQAGTVSRARRTFEAAVAAGHP